MKHLKSFGLFIALASLSVAVSSQAAEVFPDEFNGPGVHESFQWQKEPPAWDAGQITPGWLYIDGVWGGNLWCADDSTRLYQNIGDEDFEIETHIKAAWTNDGIAGIVAKSPSDDNWVKLKLWTHPARDAQLQFQKKCVESGDGLTGEAPGYRPAGGEAEIWLKLKRVGNECTGFYKTSEGEEWIETGTTSFPFKAPYEVGIYGGALGAALTVEFDYFRDNTSPFVAVSPKAKLVSTWASIKN